MQLLLSYPELSIESALRRMHLIASSMHEDAIEALEGPNKELARDVMTLDDEVDRKDSGPRREDSGEHSPIGPNDR